MDKYTSGLCYFIIPLIIILCPTFPNKIQVGTHILFVCEICCFIYLLKRKVYYIPQKSNAFYIFIFFLFCTFVDLCLDYVRGVVIVNDFFELSRPIAFLLFYSCYRYSKISFDKIEQQTIKLITILFLIEGVYSIVEFFFIKEISPISELLYKKDVSVFKDKAIGSFTQIYTYGYILLLPISFFLLNFFKQKKTKYLILFLIVFFAMLLTQSKSIYISAACCLLICLIIPFLNSSLKDKFRHLIILSIIIFISAYYFILYKDLLYNTFSYASYGLEKITAGNGGTVKTRLEQIEWALQNNHILFIGSGIGKGDIKQDGYYALESLYGLYYYRYGLLGLSLFIGLLLYTSLISYKIANKVTNPTLSSFYYALFVFFIISPLALSSSCHHDTPKVSIIFYSLIGLVHAKNSIVMKIIKN